MNNFNDFFTRRIYYHIAENFFSLQQVDNRSLSISFADFTISNARNILFYPLQIYMYCLRRTFNHSLYTLTHSNYQLTSQLHEN